MDARIQIVLVAMTAELDRKHSLHQFAGSVNLSISRFHHLFKSETGASPAQHLRALRIAAAKRLLETSFFSIKEIITIVGIKDRRRFEREFKRTYGLTPREWRRESSLYTTAAETAAK